MSWLRQAVAFGERNANRFQSERALYPLRNRPDFQLLAMDLTMPAEPFAPRAATASYLVARSRSGPRRAAKLPIAETRGAEHVIGELIPADVEFIGPRYQLK